MFYIYSLEKILSLEKVSLMKSIENNGSELNFLNPESKEADVQIDYLFLDVSSSMFPSSCDTLIKRIFSAFSPCWKRDIIWVLNWQSSTNEESSSSKI